MATTFDKVIDMALITIQDYKLDKIYSVNPEQFDKITSGFLVRELPSFTICKKSLDYDLSTKTFVSDFSNLEVSIIADLWVYAWFEFQVNNLTQISNTMTPSDSKRFSEAENLKQKSEYLDRLREKHSQKITDYDIATTDWGSWGNGSL